MAHILTDNQKKAHDLQRHLSVTANAGSGKTTVLVERYVEILATTGAQVGEVVAITFTEKAASELKRKIADALGRRIRGTEDDNVRTALSRARDRLSFAPIGTIHSFCARILRDYPIEAGVDAAFTVLEDVDRRSTMQESLQEVFRLALSDRESPHQADALTLLRVFGKSRLFGVLGMIVDKRETVERLRSPQGIYSRPDDEVLASWSAAITEYVGANVEADALRSAAETLAGFASPKAAKSVSEALTRLEARGEWIEMVRVVVDIGSVLFTQNLEFHKRAFRDPPQSAEALSAAEAVRSAYRLALEFKPFLEANVGGLHRRLLAVTRSVLALYDLAVDRYHEKKMLQGALDFDDLLILTRELLEREDIHTSIGQRFRYLMVDEYQDTNHLQYEILQKLTANYRSGNLFIVGDPKQSIYGFRDADVEVFGQTKADIVRAARDASEFTWQGKRLEAQESERRGDIVLPESFRLLRDLVAFVNVVFGRAMKTDGRSFEVSYNPLVLARQNDAPGHVELLLQGNDASVENEDAAYTECEQVARRIIQLMNGGSTVFDKGEVARPIRLSDIAVLLRTRKHLPTLERAFATHGLPYRVSGGIGFYQTQEIFDVQNYLEFLLNPYHDAALAGVLRSAFYELSDAELFEISLVNARSPGSKPTFWSKLQRYAVSGRASETVRRAHRLLAKHLSYAGRRSTFDLLRAILDETAWSGTVAATERGEQQRANVEKLLRFAREYDGRGFVGLFDFVERLTSLVESRDEGQAHLDDANIAIHVMTIHAAKGLEFPVVVLPFLHEPFQYDREPYLDRTLGLAISLKREDDPRTREPQPLTVYLKTLARDKQEAEEKRIFYVACTRARDRLILSSNEALLRSGASAYRWVLDGLAVASLDEATVIKVPVVTRSRSAGNAAPEELEFHHELDIPVLRMRESQTLSKEVTNTTRRAGVPRIAAASLSASTSGEFISATQLQTLAHCPTKFYLIHRLGVSSSPHSMEGDRNRARSGSSENDENTDIVSPTLLGTAVHAVLEHVSLGMTVDELRALTQAALREEGLSLANDGLLENEITQLVKGVLDSDAGKKAFSAGQSRAEYSVTSSFGRHYVTGTMDRVLEHDDGSWHVVDYKTDNVTVEKLIDRAEQYRTQMSLYAYLVSRLYPQQKKTTVTVMFVRHPDRPQVFGFDAEAIEQYRLWLQGMLDRIDEIDAQGVQSLPRQTSHCPDCEFFRQSHCLLFQQPST
jgi:ATP-dependent helicase/nuclease subunit A